MSNWWSSFGTGTHLRRISRSGRDTDQLYKGLWSYPILQDFSVKLLLQLLNLCLLLLHRLLPGCSCQVLHPCKGKRLGELRMMTLWYHDDVIKMEIFSALLALCAGNSPVPVNSPQKGQWRGALMFSLICVWINGWVNNREAGNLRRQQAHYDVIVMWNAFHITSPWWEVSSGGSNEVLSLLFQFPEKKSSLPGLHPSPKVKADFFQTEKWTWCPHPICTILMGA